MNQDESMDAKKQVPSKIKIAAIITGLGIGGAELSLLTGAKLLDRERFDADIYCLYDEDNRLLPKFRELGYNVYIHKVFDYSAHFLLRINYFAILKLALTLRKKKYQIVQTILPQADTVGRIAASFAGIKRRIITVCNMEKRTGMQVFWDRVLAKRTSAIVCITESVIACDKKYTKAPDEKYYRVYNGISIKEFSNKSNLDQAKENIGISKGNFVIGTVGRLHPQKDQKTLLHGFCRFLKDIPNAELVLTGDGPEKENLMLLAKQLGIETRTRFLGFRNDVSEVLSSFDVFVLSSSFEGLGDVVLEAMSMNLPVIVTDLPPLREIVRQGENGIIVPVGGDKAIADALVKLYKDPSLRARLGDKGRETIFGKFDDGTMVKKYEDLYLKLIQDNTHTRNLSSG